jgi:hypothetical protein
MNVPPTLRGFGPRARLAVLVSLLVLGCGARSATEAGSRQADPTARDAGDGGNVMGGDPTDRDTGDGGDARDAGDGGDEIGALIEEDRSAVCQKDIDCGLADPSDPCPPAPSLKCTPSAAEIRQCLDELPTRDCRAYAVGSVRSCVLDRKSPDGC